LEVKLTTIKEDKCFRVWDDPQPYMVRWVVMGSFSSVPLFPQTHRRHTEKPFLFISHPLLLLPLSRLPISTK
jgi:hypothetical protein